MSFVLYFYFLVYTLFFASAQQYVVEGEYTLNQISLNSIISFHPPGMSPNITATITCGNSYMANLTDADITIFGVSVNPCSKQPSFYLNGFSNMTFDGVWISRNSLSESFIQCNGNSYVVFKNSIIDGNTFNGGFLSGKCNIQIINTTFSFNELTTSKSVEGSVLIEKLTFSSNKIEDSFLNIIGNFPSILVSDSHFSQSRYTGKQSTGGLLKVLSDNSTINVNNCRIESNLLSPLLFIQSYSKVLAYNLAVFNSSFLHSENNILTVEITNCSFSGYNGDYKGILTFQDTISTIKIEQSTFFSNKAMTGSAISILGSFRGGLSITGTNFSHCNGIDGSSSIDVSATQGKAVFDYLSFSNVSVHNMNGKNGGFFSASNANFTSVSADKSEFRSNRVSGDGGVFLFTNSFINHFSLSDCIASNNYAKYGAFIAFYKCPEVKESSFTNFYAFENNCEKVGAAIYSFQSLTSNLTVVDSLFEKNTCQYGPAIGINEADGNIYVSDSKFLNNYASKESGCIDAYDGNLNLTGNLLSFESNGADSGAAISLTNCKLLHLSSCSFHGNVANKSIISISGTDSHVTIEHTNFTQNSMKERSTLFFDKSTYISINQCSFEDNYSGSSSSVYFSRVKDSHIIRSKFDGGKGSGFIYSESSKLEIADSTFTNIQGQVFVAKGTNEIVIERSKFLNNSNTFSDANGEGQSIVETIEFIGSLTTTDSIFSNNNVLVASIFKYQTLSGAKIIMDRCQIINNLACAVWSRGAGLVIIKNSTISDNEILQSSQRRGLFESSFSCHVTLEKAVIERNKFPILISSTSSGNFTIIESKILNNSLDTSVLSGTNGAFNFQKTRISQEKTLNLGSCFFLSQDSRTIFTDSVIESCSSLLSVGGFIVDQRAELQLVRTEVIGSSGLSGSAIEGKGASKIFISESKIYNSVSSVSNGAISITGLNTVAIISSSSLYNNSASSGASSINVAGSASLTLMNTSIYDSSSKVDGSCIIVDSSDFTMIGGSIKRCKSPRYGAGIRFLGSVSSTLKNVQVNENVAEEGGAVFFNNIIQSSILFENCTFEFNEAINGGTMSMSFDRNTKLNFTETIFRSNKARGFGGVFLSAGFSVADFVGCVFENNTATVAGVGYQDWETISRLHNCSLNHNMAQDSGGSFYLDKNSQMHFFSTSISYSKSERGSGGAIFMNIKSSLNMTNCLIYANEALLNGGAISSSSNSDCKLNLQKIQAISNRCLSVDCRGGFLSFDQGSQDSVDIDTINCVSNSAAYGGCLSFEDIKFPYDLRSESFEGNSATIFGNNINSPPDYLDVLFEDTKLEFLSGQSLKSIQVFLRNRNGDLYSLPLPQNFILAAQVDSSLNFRLTGLLQKEIENGRVAFSDDSQEANRIKIFAEPGSYKFYVGPRKNDNIYPSEKFGKEFDLIILPCLETEGYSQGIDLSCKKIECSECKNGQGRCVSAGNCSCFGLNEGLRCDLSPDTYETLSIRMRSLPTLPLSNSSQISVEMRDFLIAETQSAVGVEVTVEYRKLIQDNNGYVFKVALLNNLRYIEREELEPYKKKIEERFAFLLVEPELSSSPAFIHIMDYSHPLVIVVMILTFLMILVTFLSGLIILQKWNTPIIKASSPLFCSLIIVGIIVAFLTCLPYIGKQTNVTCSFQVILAPFAFSLIFGNLLAKTFRIYRIFGNKKMSTAPSNRQLLIFSSVIVGIEMILVIIWLAYDAPKPIIRSSGSQRYWSCSSKNNVAGIVMTSLIMIYNGFLLVFGSYLAIVTRRVYSAFKESKMIGFCIYTLSLTGVSVLPVLYFISLSIEVQFALRSFAVIFVSSFTLFILFGPKFHTIYFNPQKTDDSHHSSSDKNQVNLQKFHNPKKSKLESVAQDLLMGEFQSAKGYILLRELKPWSQWRKYYAVLYGDFFGLFHDESCSSGMGLFSIDSCRISSASEDEYWITLNKKRYEIDCHNQQELSKWAQILSSESETSTLSISRKKDETI